MVRKTSETMMGRKDKSQRLNGAEGLLIAVIGVAADDARRGPAHAQADAMEYFGGDWYRHSLGLLGLPDDWLPEGVVLN